MPETAPVLWARLGVPEVPEPAVTVSEAEVRTGPGYSVTELALRTALGDAPGFLLLPDAPGARPAILYCHAHGNDYAVGARELLDGRPALQAPYGPALAMRGYAVLSVDMPGFGARQHEGTESALAKAAGWRGETLMGRMLGTLGAARLWLAQQDRVAESRIATLGLSMGATHAYWLAALDTGVAAVAHLCAFADLAPLVATGAHDLHGPYMTVPGLLSQADMGDVAALIAPRPQLICAGLRDPLTPPEALNPALERVRSAYRAGGAERSLHTVISRRTGHVETLQMREAVLAFLDQALTE